MFSLSRGASGLRQDVLDAYSEVVYSSYRATCHEMQLLDESIREFVASPSVEGLTDCRQQWVKTRQFYSQTEVFRFYDGPIDGPFGREGAINAWPIDEVYLDYVEGSPAAGIVCNYQKLNIAREFPTINAESLSQLNVEGGEQDICVGFHALEFLLWGQDLSPNGPGQRPLSDFTTEEFAENRCCAIVACSHLLNVDLRALLEAWAPHGGNYRERFCHATPEESIGKMITGMQMMAGFELASERLAVPYDTQFPEDEQSCFSDTTHIDIIYNIKGLQNVWTGHCGLDSVTGLNALFPPQEREDLTKQIELCATLARAIPAPFDQAILGNDNDPGRLAILACMDALERLSAMLAELKL